jgi:hypothetical protein
LRHVTVEGWFPPPPHATRNIPIRTNDNNRDKRMEA